MTGGVEGRHQDYRAFETPVRDGRLEPLDDAMTDDARVDLVAMDVSCEQKLRTRQPTGCNDHLKLLPGTVLSSVSRRERVLQA
jgi:hypothetical protein